MAVKKTAENLIGKGKPGPGRPKGLPNKTTQLLKDAILQAATDAGEGDMVAYLKQQATDNPGPFMALLGKVLPMQIAGDPDNPLKMITTIELVAPDGESQG
jgi:hypothetical protein